MKVLTTSSCLVLILILCSFDFSANTGVTCTIKSRKEVYRKGETPEIDIEIKNNTTRTIYLVKSLDASEFQWRYPHSYFNIKKNLSPFYRTDQVIRCGNMDGIPESHIIKLEPGQSFDPEKGNFYASRKINNPQNFKHRGKYKIRYYYSTNNADPKEWFGDAAWDFTDLLTGNINQEVLAQYQKRIDPIARIEIVSNEIEIRIN